MVLPGTQRINDAGHLTVGGCDCVALAAQFGTPLYVIDETALRERCRQYRDSFGEQYGDTAVAFASKALMTQAICRLMDQEGMWLDVASAGEMHTALTADFPASRLILHGNNKSDEELDMAVRNQVARIVVDCESELERLAAITVGRDRSVDIQLRCTPGINPSTHDYITTGQIDSKFGLGIETGVAMRAVQRALQLDGLRLAGLHCHIGSNVFGLDSFAAAAEMMVKFMATVRDKTGHLFDELNMGGGLGIRYVEEDEPPSVREYAESLAFALRVACKSAGYPLPRLMLEPGRALIGEAGITLYTVGVVKEIPGVRTYVSVDGGLADNPRPALYDARYMVISANRANADADTVVTIAGRHCETDVLFRDVALPSPRVGDTIAVQSTGAYNYSMASNYNRYPRPAMVLVGDGAADLIVRRETLDDLVRCDAIPPRLMAQSGAED